MLTIADITSQQFHAEFAGLFACKTATGGAHLLDEAITLTAALHYTGYRHVIGTLWSVYDTADITDLIRAVYRRITVDGSLTPEFSAWALHLAVRSLRDKYPDRPRLWTPFTHTGPSIGARQGVRISGVTNVIDTSANRPGGTRGKRSHVGRIKAIRGGDAVPGGN